MGGVLIRKCEVRVVRRGGWSWGPSPRSLLSTVLDSVPSLIAEKLRRLLPEGAAGIVREPITIRVPLRLSELVGSAGEGMAPAAMTAALRSAMERPVEDALSRMVIQPDPPDPRPVQPDHRIDAAEDVENQPCFPRFLSALAKENRLAEILERLPRETTVWHAALFDRVRPTASLRAADLFRDLPGDLVAALEQITRRSTAPLPSTRAEAAEVALAVALAARTSRSPDDAAVLRAVLCLRFAQQHNSARRSGQAAASEAVSEDGAIRASSLATKRAPRHTAESAAMPRDVRFPSALPWLALAPLSRAGLLDGVAAQFEAAGMTADLRLFAAAFAAKFLGSGERLAISAFAGEPEVIPDEEINDLPRRCRAILPGLWVSLQSILVKGRRQDAPLFLFRGRAGYVLADAKEALLFGVAESIEELLSTITLAAGPRLVIDRSCAAEAGRLADLGLSCVAGFPMDWRRKPLEHGATLWTTDPAPPPAALAECAEALDQAGQTAANCARFVEEMESAPRAHSMVFEGYAGALAMAALGGLAPQSTPLEVLDQYRGFEAMTEFREERIRVRLPLGRRYLTLDRAGWLKPLRAIPWLGPRAVEFSGG
jgi:hypothetical protein